MIISMARSDFVESDLSGSDLTMKRSDEIPVSSFTYSFENKKYQSTALSFTAVSKKEPAHISPRPAVSTDEGW